MIDEPRDFVMPGDTVLVMFRVAEHMGWYEVQAPVKRINRTHAWLEPDPQLLDAEPARMDFPSMSGDDGPRRTMRQNLSRVMDDDLIKVELKYCRVVA